MVIIVATLGGALALAATAQALLVLGMGRSTLSVTVPFGWDLGRRIFINLLTVIAAVLLVGRLQIEARRPLPAAGLVLLTAVGTAGVRGLLQISVGIYSQNDVLPALADAAITGCMIGLIVTFAVVLTRTQQRVRLAERASVLPTVRSSAALVTILRARAHGRRVAVSDLRETLRTRFLPLVQEVGDIADDADGLLQMRLRALRRELEDLTVSGREHLAAFASPEGLDHGLIPAVRTFISTVPEPITVRLRVDDPRGVLAVTGSGARGFERRSILFRVITDALMSGLEFGYATRFDVTIGLSSGMARIVVSDDATSGYDELLRGLENLSARVSGLGGRLDVEQLSSGGIRTTATLPREP